MLREASVTYNQDDYSAYVYLLLLTKTGKDRQNKALAMNLAKKLAAKNFVPAYNVLGYLYEVGGTSADKELAVSYYQKAHDNGYAVGTYNLARCYINGRAVSYNFDYGVKLLKDAIGKNYAHAMYYLGRSLLKGINGFNEDAYEGFKYIKMAASQVHAEACFTCGYMYANGVGTVKDLATAYNYYEKTARFGINDARIIVGNFILEGKYVQKNYDRAFFYFMEAAKEWWMKGNREGDEFCYRALTKYF